jgi:hypothetical protein
MNKEKFVFSNEELIEKCFQKIASIPNDPYLFDDQLKIDLILQWIAEIKKIKQREEQ